MIFDVIVLGKIEEIVNANLNDLDANVIRNQIAMIRRRFEFIELLKNELKSIDNILCSEDFIKIDERNLRIELIISDGQKNNLVHDASSLLIETVALFDGLLRLTNALLKPKLKTGEYFKDKQVVWGINSRFRQAMINESNTELVQVIDYIAGEFRYKPVDNFRNWYAHGGMPLIINRHQESVPLCIQQEIFQTMQIYKDAGASERHIKVTAYRQALYKSTADILHYAIFPEAGQPTEHENLVVSNVQTFTWWAAVYAENFIEKLMYSWENTLVLSVERYLATHTQRDGTVAPQ